MEWENFKSNSTEGDEFILRMKTTETQWSEARELFTRLLEKNNISSWHIHNGHVHYNHKTTRTLNHKEMDITWVDKQAGYSHAYKCPDIGEKIAIIKNSPQGHELIPFNLFCYEVIGRRKIVFPEIKLKQAEVKTVVFNNKIKDYELLTYTKTTPSIFLTLMKKLKLK